MPIHDWTRVDAGTFHDFHQVWVVLLRNALNAGILPDGYYAMVDQALGGPIPDVLTLDTTGDFPRSGGTAIAERPPKFQIQQTASTRVYASRANRIAVRHRFGDVIAVMEIVSPGNKSSRSAIRQFIEKACGFLERGIHFLAVDLFPPTSRDPRGIHAAIWEEIEEGGVGLPAGKPLTAVSYQATEPTTAYVEPLAVNDTLPDMPIFLSADSYVSAPLEATYMTAWSTCPPPVRELLTR